jgi:hypothetical protein
MFTALGCQKNAPLLQGLIYSREKSSRRIQAGMCPDLLSQHFAGRASDHEEVSLPELCSLTHLRSGLIGLPPDFLQFVSLYMNKFHDRSPSK